MRLASLLGPEPARSVAGRVPWTRAACAGLVPPGARWEHLRSCLLRIQWASTPSSRPLEPAPASQGLVLCPVSGAAGWPAGSPAPGCRSRLMLRPNAPALRGAGAVGCTSRGCGGRLHGRLAREGGSWCQEESGGLTREPDAVLSWSSRKTSNFTYFLIRFTNLSRRRTVIKIPHSLGS